MSSGPMLFALSLNFVCGAIEKRCDCGHQFPPLTKSQKALATEKEMKGCAIPIFLMNPALGIAWLLGIILAGKVKKRRIEAERLKAVGEQEFGSVEPQTAGQTSGEQDVNENNPDK